MRPQVLANVIFDRKWILFVYMTVTLLVSVQAMFTSSFAVGIAALIGCALCFFAASTFSASFRARRIKNYSVKDLMVTGGIATVLCAVGIALMLWSGFWVAISGVYIDGWIWALVGALAGVLGTTKELAQ